MVLIPNIARIPYLLIINISNSRIYLLLQYLLDPNAYMQKEISELYLDCSCRVALPQLLLCSPHDGILDLCNRHHSSLRHCDITYDSQTQRQAQI